MSFSQSQDALYKDKCLHVILNVLLSKIQRLETEVTNLKAQNSNKQPTDTSTSLKKRIDIMELRLNTLDMREGSNNMNSALDIYLKDIDLMDELQLEDVNSNN